ncbi:hypothetical protein KP78_33520 [Jeotgalibacillus soli]|uniref:Type II secretion system protein GspF domain-containing protein n=1 Tax=Jeotgalibacillus soli TaxID=889306 RepID=A0A0C2VK62_9BACL|nr:hypothetical protein KP78_33520 [Jeotgalibacillus soli]
MIETSSLLEQQRRETKRFIQLLHYPLFLFLLFIVIVVILNVYLLPRFSSLYASVGQTSTGIISIISSILHQLPFMLLIILGISFAIFSTAVLILRKLDPHEKWSTLAKLPGIGYYVKHYHSYVFSREASYLLKGGMSIQAMLTTFMSQPYRELYHDMAHFMADELRRGQSIYATVLQFPYFTEELKRITQHGESNGQLEDEWQFYSRYCLASIEEKTLRLFSFIQPTIFLFLGVAIIGTYLIILFPMFNLMQSL